MTFNDLVSSFSTNSCVKGSATGEAIFNLIMSDDIRIKMYDCLNAGITPLSGCAKEIEFLCSNDPNCDLDLSNNTVHQTIGRMVKVSVLPFGYTPIPKTKARIPKSINSKYFDYSSKYTYVGNETQTVKKHIVNL